MPRMTIDLLVKCTGQAKRKRGESHEQFLRRITHLYCSEKGIEAIESLSGCRNLSVLYLYDNFIRSMHNLSSCSSLTHLYLQNNYITQITNLSSLHRLSKLYLSGNAITVVEGLENLKELSELHIAYQKFPEGEKLLFDPRSLDGISDSLTVLNVSGNNLDTIRDLQSLTQLTHFTASDNQLFNMKDISRVLSQWTKLTKLELLGNPLCQKFKYRDRVITMGAHIGILDGREVSDMERQFLINWKVMRKARKRQQKLSINQMTSFFSDFLPSGPDTYSANQILPAIPVPPPTLPALPARQLPHRCKRSSQQQAHQLLPLLQAPNKVPVSSETSELEDFRLPEIAPYETVIVRHDGSLLNDHLPVKSLIGS